MRLFVLSVVACSTSLASAQEVGDVVIVVSPSTELREEGVAGVVQAILKRDAVSKVLAVESNRLRVSHDKVTGWISREAVISTEEAIAFYSEEIVRNPSAWAYERRATHLLTTDPKKSLDDLEMALRLDPGYAKAYGLRSGLRLAAGDFKAAAQDIDQALELDPMLASAYKTRAILAFFIQRDLPRGFADIDKAIQLEPDDFGAYQIRGDMRFLSSDYDGALSDYDQAINTNVLGEFNKLHEVHTGRGVILERKGLFAKAAADYAEAIRQQPEYVSGHRRMAWLMSTCPDEVFRDGNQAVRHALEAHRLTEVENPLIMETLAAAYAEAGEFDQAVEWMEKALRTKPAGLVAEPRSEEERQAMLATFRDNRAWRQIPKGGGMSGRSDVNRDGNRFKTGAENP